MIYKDTQKHESKVTGYGRNPKVMTRTFCVLKISPQMSQSDTTVDAKSVLYKLGSDWLRLRNTVLNFKFSYVVQL